ncbi:5496_t:CDS:1, partial [Funneliformis mosseae]
SKSIKYGKFRVVPQIFQSRLRLQWLRRAADVMVNGISKQISPNWGCS